LTENIRLHPTSSIHHRFHLLDALRGIAAICVVIGHDKYLVHRFNLNNQYLAVDFFFCLSGFVIAFSYERRLQAGMRLRDFIASRLIRLYPVYLLGITLGFFYELLYGHRLGPHTGFAFLLAVFLVPNLKLVSSVMLFPLDVPAWSLFLEIPANIAYACLIKGRLAISWAIAILSLAVFAALFYGICHGNTLVNAGVTNTNEQFLLGFARVAGSFGLGILTLRLFRHTPHLHLTGPLRSFASAAVVAILILILQSPAGFMQTDSFRLFAIILLFPALIYIGGSANPPKSFISTCVVLGELSYPLYLTHIFFLEILSAGLVTYVSPAHHSKLAFISLPVIVAIAYLIARRFDSPVRRSLTRRYLSATPPAP